MFNQDMLTAFVQILLIAGALNWGTVATYNMDFVNQLVGSTFGSYVKMAVAVAGLYAAYQLFMSFYPAAAAAADAAPAAPAPKEEASQA